MKKAMFVIFTVLILVWVWSESNLINGPDYMVGEPILFGKRTQSQYELELIIKAAIVICFEDSVNKLAERGIETREPNFCIDINFNTRQRNDFNLVIVDHNQKDMKIVNIYSKICPRLEENELAELIIPVLEALLSYHMSGLSYKPETEDETEKVGVAI